MLAAVMTGVDPIDPLSGLRVGEHDEPDPREGWTRVRVRAASLNHHDIWGLRGMVGRRDAPLPRVLGSDAAGIDEGGRSVIIHALVTDPEWTGSEILDPGLSMLSDYFDGTLAEWVSVPTRNLIEMPATLSFAEAACLPTAWLTAYRMLFDLAQVPAGGTVLIQGAGGGLSTAALRLGSAAGLRMWATSRSELKRARAVELGAEQAFEPGRRLPDRVDAVLDSVGAATFEHSMKAVRPGGTIVVAGMTSGNRPPLDLERLFMANLRVVGTTMGTRAQLRDLVGFCAEKGLHPPVHTVLPLGETRRGFEEMLDGTVFGKVVIEP